MRIDVLGNISPFSSIFSYVFQIFSRLVVAINQPPASQPPSSHDGLILGFSYLTEVLHHFSWNRTVPDFEAPLNRYARVSQILFMGDSSAVFL